jgi:hypothetical protein
MNTGAENNSKNRAGESNNAITLGAENPEKSGHAMGYIWKSGSIYYGYSKYYSYIYNHGSVTYHGWVMFDLEDLTKWNGFKVQEVYLIVHDHYSQYFERMNITLLKTTMFEGASETVLEKVYDETGPNGLKMGQYILSEQTTSDRTLEFKLNNKAVNEINNQLNSTSEHYSFGLGMFIDKLQDGFSFGKAQWTDIRLKVTFSNTVEFKNSSEADNSVAIGDGLSGHVSKYIDSAAQDKPYGYMYVRKTESSETRGYCYWNMDNVRGIFPKEDLPYIKLNRASLRFNHYSGDGRDLYIYYLSKNVILANSSNIYSYCGDGTRYYGPDSTTGVDNEYQWDLGKIAVNDLQVAFTSKSYFNLGIITNSTSEYFYAFFWPKISY